MSIIVSLGISISNEDENLLLRQVLPSVFILLGAQYTRRERIKHVGSTDVRYGHGFLLGLLVHPLASHYLPTSHSCLIQNYMTKSA